MFYFAYNAQHQWEETNEELFLRIFSEELTADEMSRYTPTCIKVTPEGAITAHLGPDLDLLDLMDVLRRISVRGLVTGRDSSVAAQKSRHFYEQMRGL